jgi:hypothetical protein
MGAARAMGELSAVGVFEIFVMVGVLAIVVMLLGIADQFRDLTNQLREVNSHLKRSKDSRDT